MLRSSFLISKVVEKTPQLMNEQNFRMTIKRLNQSINSLHIDLNSEDLIIDLSDLVLTKGTLSIIQISILRNQTFFWLSWVTYLLEKWFPWPSKRRKEASYGQKVSDEQYFYESLIKICQEKHYSKKKLFLCLYRIVSQQSSIPKDVSGLQWAHNLLKKNESKKKLLSYP